MARVEYNYPWRDLIGELKFKSNPGWARVLGSMFEEDESITELLARCDVWTPIPLTSAGLNQRGYNQSWELLKALSRHKPGTLLIRPDILQRRASPTAQHRLSREQRLNNPHLHFSVGSRWIRRIQGRHILVLDDVMTTGATLNAAANALLAAGAAKVSGLVFARTPATPFT